MESSNKNKGSGNRTVVKRLGTRSDSQRAFPKLSWTKHRHNGKKRLGRIPTSIERQQQEEDEKQAKIARHRGRYYLKSSSLGIAVTVMVVSIMLLLLWRHSSTGSKPPQVSQQQQQQQPQMLRLPIERPTNSTLARKVHSPPKPSRVFPRVIQIVSTPDSLPYSPPQQVENDLPSQRLVRPMTSVTKQQMLENSKDYEDQSVSFPETESCKFQYPWQLDSKPNCNAIHELGMSVGSSPFHLGILSMSMINHGYRRDVWSVQFHSHAANNDHKNNTAVEQVVLKTQRAKHMFSPRNLDRNRLDAMVMEHLTVSPWILDIYVFCASSGIYEFASQGSMDDIIFSNKKETVNETKSVTTIPTDFVRYGTYVFTNDSTLRNHPQSLS